VLLREEDAGRPKSVEPKETASRHKSEREEQYAGIPAPLGRLTCRVSEAERHSAYDAEDHEVERIVLYVRIEL